MARKITKLVVNELSLVDKAANAREIIFKGADGRGVDPIVERDGRKPMVVWVPKDRSDADLFRVTIQKDGAMTLDQDKQTGQPAGAGENADKPAPFDFSEVEHMIGDAEAVLKDEAASPELKADAIAALADAESILNHKEE